MKQEHERLLSLIEFAQASAKLKGNTVCEASKHEFCEYEHNLQGIPGLHFNVGGEEEEIWLVVDRLRETKAPAPTNSLLELWLEVSNNPTKEPALKAGVEFSKLLDEGFVELKEGDDPVDINRLVLLQDFEQTSEVESQLKVYITIQWMPWASEEKKRRRNIQFYGKLFTLK